MSSLTFDLHLPDGIEGVRILNLENRSVFAVLVPRTALVAALKREELSGVGVYLLLRAADGEPRPRVYVGEANNCAVRLRQHDGAKDFWTHAIIVLNRTFTKAHGLYLEHRCVEAAREAGRYIVENDLTPCGAKLPEPMRAAAEDAFYVLGLLLDVLGVPLFAAYAPSVPPLPVPDPAPAPEPPPRVPKPSGGARPPRRPLPEPPSVVAEPALYVCRGRTADARGRRDGEHGFVVLAGSVLADGLTESGRACGMDVAREAMLRDGRLATTPDARLSFTGDVAFRTPSAAARLVLGTSANGWREWRRADTGAPLDAERRPSS